MQIIVVQYSTTIDPLLASLINFPFYQNPSEESCSRSKFILRKSSPKIPLFMAPLELMGPGACAPSAPW